MKKEDTGSLNEIVIYEAQDGITKLSVSFDGDTVWLTQTQIAKLFGTKPQAITKHVQNIYAEGELEEGSTCSKMEQVREEGNRLVKRNLTVYNLDMILSVGYRVNSKQATHFRRWANTILSEYLIKGFAIDDDRLKEGKSEYWRELFERIRDIRSSEKMLYRQVLDLYATAIDYDPKADESIKFFKIVQNKLHYGAHGHTAAEVIYNRADAEKPFMGLTTFKGDQVTKQDIGIAKNYLSEEELKKLNSLVSGYFDIAEFRAQQHVPTRMVDYVEQLDSVLSAAGASTLKNAGHISHKQALAKAEKNTGYIRRKLWHLLSLITWKPSSPLKSKLLDTARKQAADGKTPTQNASDQNHQARTINAAASEAAAKDRAS